MSTYICWLDSCRTETNTHPVRKSFGLIRKPTEILRLQQRPLEWLFQFVTQRVAPRRGRRLSSMQAVDRGHAQPCDTAQQRKAIQQRPREWIIQVVTQRGLSPRRGKSLSSIQAVSAVSSLSRPALTRRIWMVAGLLSFLTSSLLSLRTAAANERVEEPKTYRMRQYRGPVPKTLAGATVVHSAQELHSLLKEKPESLLLDVYVAPARPKDLPSDQIWLEPRRKTLPGARWFANVGFGELTNDMATFLEATLGHDTGSRLDHPIIVFCEPNCWHSWNAAKRIVSLGYTSVYWFPPGVKGWSEAGFSLKTAQPLRPK